MIFKEDKPRQGLSRRSVLAGLAGTAGAWLSMKRGDAQASNQEAVVVKGRIKQSVSRWCYGKIPMDDFCREVKAMGLVGIDLLSVEDSEDLKPHGLISTMCNGPGRIEIGWNDPKHHDELVAKSEELLPKIAEAGWPNMVVFSGNRRGMPDDEGLKNCVTGLKRILPLAEQVGVTVTMELLNSKRNHKDYMCDHTSWGVELAKQLGSKRFKLLYDIYHMQIMEGDIIATIQENIDYIGHIHTGGVPGRNEIDESQELNYRRICQAIAETSFDGYLAHEFVPKSKDPLASLRAAAAICDV